MLFKFKRDKGQVAQGLVRHRAINSGTRDCCELPESIELWLGAPSLELGVTKFE